MDDKTDGDSGKQLPDDDTDFNTQLEKILTEKVSIEVDSLYQIVKCNRGNITPAY